MGAGTENEEIFVVVDASDTDASDGGLTIKIGPAGPNAPESTQTAHDEGSIVKISEKLEPRCSRL